jgi:hypothetical protein
MTMIVKRILLAVTASIVVIGGFVAAQSPRQPSPAGSAETQIGGRFVDGRGAAGQFTDPKTRVFFLTRGPVYQGGKWVEIKYGRPLKRGRDLWGSGADYGRQLYAGAPVWRAGANVSTRLNTEMPLVLNSKTIPAGEYSLFIDLKPNNWTLIVSTYGVQTDSFDQTNKTALWGSYNYTPEKDVIRAPMRLEVLPHALEQLTWAFADMTDAGGTLAIMWDTVMASVPFRIVM